MRRWLARARRMTPADYLTAFEVLRLAVWVEGAIRVLPFSRLLERLKRDSPAGSEAPVAWTVYQRLPRFVAAAYDILPFQPTCLRQSLVLYGLLERRGVPSRFCVGVSRRGPALAAHAWVDCDGVVHDAASAGSFVELTPPAKELPYVVNEQLRLLERGEVAPTGHLGQLL
jgi:hypothetical protein